MGRILGLDLGTNSIGWAVVDRNEDNTCTLIDRGVHIFQEGVAREKGAEKPAVQERTAARSSRRHYFRRRLRKIELLRVLIDNRLCPYLSPEMLSDWKQKKKYPMDDAFLAWQRTDDNSEDNPYYARKEALSRKLDLDQERERYLLGRALYHLNQRRGFLSGRKDSGQDSEKGTVLSKEMESAGCKFLGEYFYLLYKQGGKIRTRYTSREEHYRKEFEEICRVQELTDDLKRKLERAIFYQRPLKSQKGAVGKCPFEKTKPRCPVSHPLFEEFRMLQFLNGVRILAPQDEDFRALNENERISVYPLFFRKRKPHYPFDELATKIAGKNNWSFRDDPHQTAYKFNYRADMTVSGCPVTAAILSAFDLKYCTDWMDAVCTQYLRGDGKTKEQTLDDLWHSLFFFPDAKNLSAWLKKNFQLEQKQADSLAEFSIPQGYGNISLKALRKIVPWLRKGYVYSHAVFYANLEQAVPVVIRNNLARLDEVKENIRVILEDGSNAREDSKIKGIRDYLLSVGDGSHPEKIYHPSVMDLYPQQSRNAAGEIHLGSPRTDAFKNPMAMRALFRLRALVNELLDRGLINPETKINIEFARGLNDANKRRAIELYQQENEKARIAAKEAIRRELGIEPTDTDVLKYLLWEEQEHRCLYTGEQIGITQFIGDGNIYDIEHTIPRSLGGDDSRANKTLCNNVFNREIKGGKIPSELANHNAILDNVEFMKEKAEQFDRKVYAAKKKQRFATTKEAKDRAIQDVHLNKMRRDYWKDKYERFAMKSVPEGFTKRQGVDIGIIGRYARMYLNSVFHNIYVVKGATTADFRKAWGLQDQYAKKERVNHVHHCIDAITIACIGKTEYDQWKWYMERMDAYRFGKGAKPVFEKPWKTFTEDVLTISEELVVSHHTPDNMLKKSKKILRVRGEIQRNEAGKIMYCRGDTARRALHKDTFYGAIQKDDTIRYVVRKSLDSIEDKDIKNIVDDIVREKVMAAKESAGSLKKAVEQGIWMNEEKRIPIKKVRLYVPSVASPIPLKAHRDQSPKEHKQSFYVANDSNYCMAVYQGKKTSFRLLSTIDAVRNLKAGKKASDWFPIVNENGDTLRFVLKVGTMVLFYEKDAEEIKACSQAELSKRLYKITAMDSQGRLYFKHNQEARPDNELDVYFGAWSDQLGYCPKIRVSSSKLKLIVEGIDFTLSTSGSLLLLR